LNDIGTKMTPDIADDTDGHGDKGSWERKFEKEHDPDPEAEVKERKDDISKPDSPKMDNLTELDNAKSLESKSKEKENKDDPPNGASSLHMPDGNSSKDETAPIPVTEGNTTESKNGTCFFLEVLFQWKICK
jgi:hypothetical protein